MDDKETWTVVKFVEESSVAAVPTKWIFEDKCLWPPFIAEKLNLAIKYQKIDTCWPSHKVQVFRNSTFDSYEIARAKAKKAEDTSDLSSTDTEKNKRKLKKRKIYSSESEEEFELSVLPNMPSLPKQRNIEIDDHIPTETSGELCSPQQTVTPSSTRRNLISQPSTSTKCNCCPHHAEVNNEILRQLYFLKSVHIELLKEVKNIKVNTSNEDLCNMVPILSNLKVPCATVEELQQIEDVLKISDNFKNMVNELCKWGGSSILDFVKRCMGTLITNKLATNYSWLGRRNKQEFCKFSIAAVIVEAAIKSKKCNDKKVAEQEIGRWLRRAGDRLKTFKENTESE
ncbi:uncharacterized protein LOC126887211 [Diabrotica virgifera virgifera]|uniref:DUF4806 domain-containing protein n=1 Tax=Diabrotica virgifera virgifera TaxID=50390 RepID=A0ABM5KKB0_DIAVI|nr:uncharacterized protein LOC126887211 [Diabrotica virgifera virgifera]XP_050510570.1 uncharacterized protein LOC126887211 [Diabrotica virgifera virgifera]